MNMKLECGAYRVGLPVREYSYSPATPGTFWAKVVAREMGTATAPVRGSGSWPAWIAVVLKPWEDIRGKTSKEWKQSEM